MIHHFNPEEENIDNSLFLLRASFHSLSYVLSFADKIWGGFPLSSTWHFRRSADAIQPVLSRILSPMTSVLQRATICENFAIGIIKAAPFVWFVESRHLRGNVELFSPYLIWSFDPVKILYVRLSRVKSTFPFWTSPSCHCDISFQSVKDLPYHLFCIK